jgi:hypothetical protein
VPEQRHSSTPQPSAPDEEPTDDSIVHFILAGLLPPGHILALHRFLGTLSHLTLVQEQPRMLFETGSLLTRHDRQQLRRKTDETGGERDAPR